MKTTQITYYHSNNNQFALNAFEDAYYDSKLKYSLYHVALMGNIPEEKIMQALEESLRVCNLAGINSKRHFKRIYVFDSKTESLNIDWLMSKTGFNLLLIHIPSLNEKLALWLWNLADQD